MQACFSGRKKGECVLSVGWRVRAEHVGVVGSVRLCKAVSTARRTTKI